MATKVSVRILAKGNNDRGDLFARLMSDLFLTLGYDNVRLNISRSGREVDIEAEHRHERRRAIAECKAWDDKVGGTEINKFAGKLRPERRRRPRVPITPYFISLSGFTETSVDQEADSGTNAVILLDAPKVVEELIKGRILVPVERATEAAGKYAAFDPTLTLDPIVDLLAHPRGWVWAIFYGTGWKRTHVALIHADGTWLSPGAAAEVMPALGELLPGIICTNETAIAADDEAQQNQALLRYYEYLSSECGFILLDGLPADAEVGTLRLRLENLFVPLRLTVGPPESAELQDEIGPHMTLRVEQLSLFSYRAPRPVHVGEILEKHRRLAVLASPGAGKSTLLKRLAVAYSDPTRRALVDDGLPERSWIPLFFRCRELRDKARASFSELLDVLAGRAFIGDLKEAFRTKVERALRSGDILLLIDGLDEIADAGDRAAFVRNLRTMLAIYPEVSVVATSREAGFRHVAGLLAAVCTPAKLAPFDDQDIRRLTVAWHREVVGDRPDVASDAARLATTICGNDRIKLLAENPLLLTTLLLVKRWVGQLPTRRSVLYGKAVEVLLMTWNVEGHAPLEQEESLPQLCYVASVMMHRGIQKISRPELAGLLNEARRQLTELAFARIGVTEFIEKVEHRSSLLMRTGVDVVDGTLLEFYEFRHLTFQEYLTAKAIVEGWYQQRLDTDSIVSVLEPHLSEAKWREVIPLAAVLAGRKADPLVARLMTHTDKRMFRVLTACLADEAQATPATIRAALQLVASKRNFSGAIKANVSLIIRSKYGKLLREEVGAIFLREPTIWYRQFLSEIVTVQLAIDEPSSAIPELEVTALLKNIDILKRCEGALALSRIIRTVQGEDSAKEFARLTSPLLTEGPAAQAAACQAFARPELWGWASVFSQIKEMFAGLLDAWRGAPTPETRSLAGLAVAHIPILLRDEPKVTNEHEVDEFLRTMIKEGLPDKASAAVASYYRQSPFSDAELLDLLRGCDAPLAPWRHKLGAVYNAIKEGSAQI